MTRQIAGNELWRTYKVQVPLIVVISFSAALATWQLQIKNQLNWLWIAGLPVVFAMISHRDGWQRAGKAIGLLFCSLLGLGLAAAYLGYP